MKKIFTLLFFLLSLTGNTRGAGSGLTFEEKTEKSSLIFAGKLLRYSVNNDLPDSMIFVATDVWKGRYLKGDTIFILNDLNGGGIAAMEEEEEYVIYAWANIVVPYSGCRPVWSTTETEKLDDKYNPDAEKNEWINGVLFSARGANRVRTIFCSSDLLWTDSLNPTEPVILYNEKMISLKALSQTEFYFPVEVVKVEMNNKKEKKIKEAYYLKIKSTGLFQAKNNFDKIKRRVAKNFKAP